MATWESIAAQEPVIDPVSRLSLFSGMVETPRGRQDLLDIYIGKNIGMLVQDLEARPKHYTERQQDIIVALRAGAPANPPATAAERSDLLLQFTRRTEAVKPVAKARRKMAQQEPEDRSSFEEQDYGPTIKFI